MADVIVQEGDPVLRAHAEAIREDEFGTPELQNLVDRMLDSLDKEKDGVALAAPQIGIGKRIFVVRYDRLHTVPPDVPPPAPDAGVYINPEFVKASRRREEMDEGCLSVRRIYGKTLRHQRATVRARHVDGSRFERGGGGILAQVFQHETDHLDGVLFIDHAFDCFELTPEEFEERRERRSRAERANEALESEHDS
jgi:peptide deformylase